MLEIDPEGLQYVDDKLKTDIDVVKTAFNKDKNSLKYASKEAAKLVVEENPDAIEFVDPLHKKEILDRINKSKVKSAFAKSGGSMFGLVKKNKVEEKEIDKPIDIRGKDGIKAFGRKSIIKNDLTEIKDPENLTEKE